MPRIESVHAEIIEIPLKYSFATSKDNLSRQVTRPVVLTLTLEKGEKFFGEAVPVLYVTGETQESVLGDYQRVAQQLVGLDVADSQSVTQRIGALLPESPTARAGLEIAVFSAAASVAGMSVTEFFGGSRSSVETDLTLPMVDDAVDRAIDAATRGFRNFKLKVGSPDLQVDFGRLIDTHRAIPGAKFRIDANQAFDVSGALRFLDRALASGVEVVMMEQPVPKEDIAALSEVAKRSPVPVFADETVLSPECARRIIENTEVQGINIKLMKAGVGGALEIIRLAKEAGKLLMIGCMLETRRGISFSLGLACGTGAFDLIDLDSHLIIGEPGENLYFHEDGPILRPQV